MTACLLAALANSAAAAETSCTRDSTPAVIERQFAQLRRAQNADVQQTLDAIDGMGRKLLALRSYLRQKDVASRWSWTRQQIENYKASPEYQALLAEIDRIRAHFEADNPGYQLYANTEVRSLDQQIERWNSNTGVGVTAGDLQSATCSGVKSLRAFLLDWQPESPAPLAAPGLSQHGRARAIDFQVHQGSRVVAGPEVARIDLDWIAAGWSGKLATAIKSASTKFTDPRKMPNEPWHYEYGDP